MRRKRKTDPILLVKNGKKFFQFPGLTISVLAVGVGILRIGIRESILMHQETYRTMLIGHKEFRDVILN